MSNRHISLVCYLTMARYSKISRKYTLENLLVLNSKYAIGYMNEQVSNATCENRALTLSQNPKLQY